MSLYFDIMAFKPKKIVSISGLFRKRSASEKDNARGVDKSGKITKPSHRKKHVIVPEHILARDFSGTISIKLHNVLC